MIRYDEELMDMLMVSSLGSDPIHGGIGATETMPPSQWVQTKVIRFTTDIPHLTNSGQPLLL